MGLPGLKGRDNLVHRASLIKAHRYTEKAGELTGQVVFNEIGFLKGVLNHGLQGQNHQLALFPDQLKLAGPLAEPFRKADDAASEQKCYQKGKQEKLITDGARRSHGNPSFVTFWPSYISP